MPLESARRGAVGRLMGTGVPATLGRKSSRNTDSQPALSGWRVPGRPVALAAAAFALLLGVSNAFGQQSYVSRWDVYGGYGYLNSPHINLQERGFHGQVGTNWNTWLSLGFDYSYTAGHTSLGPELLPDTLRAQLTQLLQGLAMAGKLPPGYALSVPIDSVTQNFAAGPQFSCRRWNAVTLFIRPSVGAIREVATPKTTDAIEAMVLTQLTPSGKKQDWTGFYGFGGGMELTISRHMGLRMQFDLVRDHLFNDILKDSRGTLRLSVGPMFHMGRNVAR